MFKVPFCNTFPTNKKIKIWSMLYKLSCKFRKIWRRPRQTLNSLARRKSWALFSHKTVLLVVNWLLKMLMNHEYGCMYTQELSHVWWIIALAQSLEK